ncbi:MAG TPA: MFS transporter [Puia sp.]|nr:MFS transporter [Puia sp.]
MSSSNSPIRKVIIASAVGTMIEWYDFFIFGSLATVIASQFFPKTNPTAALLSTLATFAAGFIVRPFGALVFGRLGDLIGRKYTFLLTLIIMGGSTFVIGLVPKYETIGFAAPLIVLILRLLQGLALGGEYGGAATYVAEHSPDNKRGFYTSWIQTTATLGLFVSLGVILLTRHLLDNDQAKSIAKFNDWGWRIPFLISIILVGVSIYIRLKMSESPLFTKLKAEGKTSTNPLKESFTHKENLKMVLLALFGATMGQGVIWYTGQFYAQSFIENVCKVDFDQSRTIFIWAILFTTPFFVMFGALSDKFGRKWIIVGGMLLSVLCYRFLFSQLLNIADEKNKTQVTQLSQVKTNLTPIPNSQNSLRTMTTKSFYDDGMIISETKKDTLYVDHSSAKPEIKISKTLGSTGYWKMVFIVFIMIFTVTIAYGPIVAFLVELFPTKIRYTSMSLPYHIGNGIFGGLTPFFATLLTTIYTKDKLVGLTYPLVISLICAIVCILYVSNKRNFSFHE